MYIIVYCVPGLTLLYYSARIANGERTMIIHLSWYIIMHISLCTLICIHFISEIYYVRKAQIFNRIITLLYLFTTLRRLHWKNSLKFVKYEIWRNYRKFFHSCNSSRLLKFFFRNPSPEIISQTFEHSSGTQRVLLASSTQPTRTFE